MSMQNIKSQKYQAAYTIEDNILKGPEIPTNLISWNIGEVLLDAFDKKPDHISQIDAATSEKTTYADMKDHSIRCALWLEKQGLGDEDVVSLWTHNQLEAYIPVFASYIAQIIINPWIPNQSLDQTRYMLRIVKPKIIFTQTNYIDVLDEALKLETLDAKIVIFGKRHSKYQSLAEIMQLQSSYEVENYRPKTHKTPEEVAIVITTSGSTGGLKPVMISAEAMLENAFHMKHKNVLLLGNPNSIAQNCAIVSFVMHNSTRIISLNKDPREVCRNIERFKVNSVFAASDCLDRLAYFEEVKEFNLERLESIQTSGWKVNKVIFDKLKTSCLHNKFHQRYGITEIGTVRAMHSPGDSYKSHHSIGFLAPNLQLKVIDRSTKEVLGPNSLGEIAIKIPKKVLGYYKNPEATKKIIDAEGWYYTGDAGYYDETGEIFIMGRYSDAFVYRGQEFFSCEIEDILWQHSAVDNAAVVSVPHEIDGEHPVAFVVIRAGEMVSGRELMNLLATSEKLKTLPVKIQFVDAIPLNPSLKVSKSLLKEWAVSLTNKS